MGRTWSARLAIGVPAIDAQHQELFERADALLAAMSGGKGGQEVVHLVGYLEAYVEEHFGAEERLMHTCGYPWYVSHRAQHDHFRGELRAVAEVVTRAGPASATVLKLNGLVRSWLVQHIGSVDVKVAEFLGSRRTEVRLEGGFRPRA